MARRPTPSCYEGIYEPDVCFFPHLYVLKIGEWPHCVNANQGIREWLRRSVRKGYVTQTTLLGTGIRVLFARDKDKEATLFKLTFSDMILSERHLHKPAMRSLDRGTTEAA